MENQQANTKERTLADKLSAVGWGLFFVWIGVAWLLNVGTGIGLLGSGYYSWDAGGAEYFNLNRRGSGLLSACFL